MLRGSHTRDALLAFHRLASTWNSRTLIPSAKFACVSSETGLGGHDGSTGGSGDEFWLVEGKILRLKGDRNKTLYKVIDKSQHSPNLNLSRKKVAAARHRRVQATHLAQSLIGQEQYWKTYLERFQHAREQWEKLFWDGIPEEEPVVETVNANDPFTILGLKRRDKPYSPLELKCAYRELALKYHPDHNPGKDAEAKFERIWNAYKMLQHRRSWR